VKDKLITYSARLLVAVCSWAVITIIWWLMDNIMDPGSGSGMWHRDPYTLLEIVQIQINFVRNLRIY